MPELIERESLRLHNSCALFIPHEYLCKAVTYSISPDSVDNIWALPLDGGKPVRLTNFNASSGARDIGSYAFAPDGKRLAVTRYNVTNSLVLIDDFK